MSTTSDLYVPVRILKGDLDLNNPELADGVIDAGVKLCLSHPQMRSGYSADSSNNITPDLPPNDFFLLAAITARLFLGVQPDVFSSAVRAHRWHVTKSRDAVHDLDAVIVKARSGAMFDGWSSYLTWLEGQSGIPSIWLHLTRMKIKPPFETVTLTTAGISAGQSL